MAKLHHATLAHPAVGSFTPIAFAGSSRLTFKRLRRPTPLPTIALQAGLGRYLDRLNWLFGGR